MPFTDSFVQFYAGFQESPNKWLQDSPPANSQIVETTPYDPLKNSSRRVALGVTFSGNPGHNAFTSSLYSGSPSLRSPIPRFVVTYNESFSPWNGNDTTPQQQVLLTFDPVTITNNTGNDATFRGIELVHPIIEGPITDPTTESPETLTLTRVTDPAPGVFAYTAPVTFRFPRRSRLQMVNSPYTTARAHLDDLPAGVFHTLTNIGGITVGQTVDVYNLGAFSLARFIYPDTILLVNGQSIDVNLGTITLNYNAEAAVC